MTPIWSLSLEAEIDEEGALLVAALERAATLPDRERNLRLVHRLGGLLLDAHAQWLADVRHEPSRNQRHHPVWTMVASAGAVIVGRCAG